jgi:glycosyltransferase involved in cell wall biosynthesis
VLVDATAIPPDRGGVGRYVDELLPELVAAGADLVVVCQPRDVDGYTRILPAERVLAAPDWVVRRPLRLIWEQVGLPRLARRLRAGVLHCPHYTMPLAARVPVVVTLHDATFFTHPQLHSAVKRRFFQAWTRISLRRARRCIVPSRATRNELLRVAGARPDRVDVAHHGVDRTTFHVPEAGEVAAVRSALDLGDRPYVAFLGTLEPRKNVPALVRGWIAACRGRRQPPALVLAGGPGWDPDVDVAASEVPPELHLVRAGYLPLDRLAAFLGGAEVVAYPSLGEGFGLPVAEAMACGAPVLTTRLLSLPEVAGDAAAYTGTTAGEIAADLARLLDDPGRRAELRTAARQRAECFTWAACARAHVQSYAAAAGPTPARRRPPGE